MNANNQAYFRSRKPPKALKANVGDRVAYTRYFLKCIGTPPNDAAWHRRGTIESISGRIATVKWDDDPDSMGVLLTNLARPGPNLRFCE